MNYLKEEHWVKPKHESLSRAEKIRKFSEAFRVPRLYEDTYGGGSAMSDVAMAEFATLRAKVLDTEQTLKLLYEHVQRPQPGRQLPVQFPTPFGGRPNLMGVAAAEMFSHQSQLQFLNHSIRADEEFAVAEHSDALGALAGAGWRLPDAVPSEGEGGGGSGRGAESLPRFRHLAHQFKTMCFSCQLLQRTGVALNIYNTFYFLPGGTPWALVVSCFVVQVASPVLLCVSQAGFLEYLSGDHRHVGGEVGRYEFASIAAIVFLFNVINLEIFSKQAKNCLLAWRLRHVVWNWSGSWAGAAVSFMDIFANLVNPCIVAAIINIVLFDSRSILDALLNALALNFIIEVDEYVPRGDMDDALLAHERELGEKIVSFLGGDLRLSCRYSLTAPAEGEPTRKVFHEEIRRTYRAVVALLALSFGGSFLALMIMSVQ